MSPYLRLALLVLVAVLAAAVVAPGVSRADSPSPCAACGSSVPTDALFCPECGHATETTGVFCWRCGTRATAGSIYCTRCGARVTSAAEAATTPESLPVPAPVSPATAETLAAAPAKPTLQLAAETTLFPPRMFSFPTGEILPSLAAQAASGWTFGFSDEKRASRWAVSAGLGGVGEIALTSATVTHLTDPESDALAGFRVKIPTAWLGESARQHLFAAWNLAATGENTYASGPFIADDGSAVQYLSYRYRETTTGASVTWKLSRVQLTGLLHVTDLRAADVTYETTGAPNPTGDQRVVYTNLGAGLGYDVDSRTRLLWEIRTQPRVRFSGAGSADLEISNLWETTAGIRFFPFPLVGLDAFVGVDEDAEGLADANIGFGLHFVIAPSMRRKAS